MASRADRPSTRASGEFTPHESHIPPSLPCNEHERRLADHSNKIKVLEETVDDTIEKLEAAEKRLNHGDVTFAEFRKDIHSLTSSVSGLTGTIRWVGGMIVAAVVAAVMGLVIK